MHNLLHCDIYVKLFGPLALRSTLALERKHKFCTDWAKVMGCFKNPAFSFIERHQSLLVITSANYKTIDFFPTEQHEAFIHDIKPEGFTKLVPGRSSCKPPHKSKKGVLRHFIVGNTDHWIQGNKFWVKDEDILIEGLVYSRSNFETHHLGDVLTLAFESPKFILAKFVSHRNDFIVQVGGHNILMKGIL